jgi:hypothetical protein
MTPIDVAEAVIDEMFSKKLPIDRDEKSITFSHLVPYEEGRLRLVDTEIGWHPKNSLMGVTSIFRDLQLQEWVGGEAFFEATESLMDPYLDGDEEDGYLKVFLYDDRILVPAYEAVINYSVLDNDELGTKLGVSLGRSIHAMTLLSPVLDEVRGEQKPSPYRLMKLVERAHGYCQLARNQPTCIQ